VGWRGGEGGLPFEAICAKGIVSEAICEHGNSRRLVIIGRKGEHAEWACDDLGTSVERVVRRAASPVLVTPKHFTPINKALVGFDGSRQAREALSLAAELHRRVNLDVTVLVVGEGAKADAIAREAA